MMYNIAVCWDPSTQSHTADDFNVNSSEVWEDDKCVVFRGYGTRASITSERRRLTDKFPECEVKAFWTPDKLVELLELIGLWRVSERIWALCEKVTL